MKNANLNNSSVSKPIPITNNNSTSHPDSRGRFASEFESPLASKLLEFQSEKASDAFFITYRGKLSERTMLQRMANSTRALLFSNVLPQDKRELHESRAKNIQDQLVLVNSEIAALEKLTKGSDMRSSR